jgi:CRP/FNR family transcriptional regulator, cyclic AMP receptor protein
MGATICNTHAPLDRDGAGTQAVVALDADLVRVFDHEPDLLGGVDARSADHLRRRAAAPRMWVDAGPWEPPDDETVRRSLGLIVLDGLMTRTISVSERECPELVGAGDLLRPWDHVGDEASVAQGARWTALQRTTLAVLDERFAAIVCRWPPVVSALLSRTIQRSRTIAFHCAIAHVRHADARLLMLLWHLADRWGHVTPAGVHVPVRLTHELMAHLACMRRPTASSALQRLVREGEIARRGDGTWLLLGAPPATRERPVGHPAAA